jgi:hypothetical protein
VLRFKTQQNKVKIKGICAEFAPRNGVTDLVAVGLEAFVASLVSSVGGPFAIFHAGLSVVDGWL